MPTHIAIHLVVLLLLVLGEMLFKNLRLHHFQLDGDEIWQDCSSSKYASLKKFFFDVLLSINQFIDHVFVEYVNNAKSYVILSRWKPWHLLHDYSCVCQLPAHLQSMCEVNGSLYALQFLFHSTLILVYSHCHITTSFLSILANSFNGALPYWRLDAKRPYLLPFSKPCGRQSSTAKGHRRLSSAR